MIYKLRKIKEDYSFVLPRVEDLENAETTPQAENKELAEHLKIHSAWIAGRVRIEQNNFKLLSRLVGSGKVRNLF